MRVNCGLASPSTHPRNWMPMPAAMASRIAHRLSIRIAARALGAFWFIQGSPEGTFARSSHMTHG